MSSEVETFLTALSQSRNPARERSKVQAPTPKQITSFNVEIIRIVLPRRQDTASFGSDVEA
jgi:hypothetical protein